MPVTIPNLLMSKVLKSRYFPQSDSLDSKAKVGASWLWQSRLTSVPLLSSGLRKQVGDGRSVNIWNDCWLPRIDSGKISSSRPAGCTVEWVSELLCGHEWNTELLQSLLTQEEIQKIQQMPIRMFGGKDKFKWIHSTNGFYTTKSGYVVEKAR